MSVKNLKQKSAAVHDFSVIPRSQIPRTRFPHRHTHKLPCSASWLIPIYVEEVLPGDVYDVSCTHVCRTATPIVPFMDNWRVDIFFFFEPMRLLWTNFPKFMGEQQNPGDSTSFTIPTVTSPVGGWPIGTVADYMGLPTVGQVGGAATVTHSCLPLRAYNDIYDKWFRDENLQNSVSSLPFGDGPDNNSWFPLQPRGKRHDYFTSGLPNLQKGSAVVTPLSGTATVKTNASALITGAQTGLTWTRVGGAAPGNQMLGLQGGLTEETTTATGTVVGGVYPNNLYADLSTATSTTINALRLAFQTQKMLERDMRGGTRYKELVLAHFDVNVPDARLQRPEYIGGGSTPIICDAIPQTSATGLTGATTPIGTLSATGRSQGRTGFNYASTEHGYIIGLASVTCDLNYQQGMRRLWKRSTRLDFYLPVFQALGEQSIYNYEIYSDGSANDALTFAYQERWAEYRYGVSRISGLFRSTAAGTIDYWHSAQKFTALPTLNSTFIADDAKTVIQRNLAGGAATANQQFLFDFLFDGGVTRPLPRYSVPGNVDRF